jgi:hypothetical protein
MLKTLCPHIKVLKWGLPWWISSTDTLISIQSPDLR